jgi:hypothetical protein
MALDSEERKIAALFAVFEEINARVDGTVRRLELSLGNLDPVVRQTIRNALMKELAGLSDEAKKTMASLERLRRAADWRQLLVGVGFAALVVVIALCGLWLSTPSSGEMDRLRAERQQLQAAIDLLASRGGRADLKRCGTGDEHLCVRVDLQFGRYGDGRDYYVIRGY